jgi:hypothetical protein
MKLSYKKYAQLMDEMVAEGYDVLEASEMIFTEEQVWEEVENWVNSLLEEGYDLSDCTWEEMYESYIEEQGPTTRSPGSIGYKPKKMGTETGRQLNAVFGQGNRLLGSSPRQTSANQRQNLRGGRSRPVGTGAAPAAATPRVVQTSTPAGPAATSRPAGPATSQPRQPGREAMIASNIARSQSAGAKSTPTSSSTASTPMQQWAAANPKLAAASAERERTRGTSATTNPLMKDFKSRLPAPQTPSPSTAAKGFELASKGVDLSKPSAPSPSTAAIQSAGSAAAAKPAPTSAAATGFKLAAQGIDLSQTKKNQQKINAGMEIRGDRLQEDLRVSEYGKNARPDSLLEAYQAIYNS